MRPSRHSEGKRANVLPSSPGIRSMNCRLLYLIGQLDPGGAQRQLYYLLQAMDREYYQPAVAVWSFWEEDVYVPRIRALGVPLYGLPQTRLVAAKLARFRHLVKALQPELVHAYSFYLNFAASWAVSGTRTVGVGSVRGDFIVDKKDSGSWLGSLSARWPGFQICNSLSAVQNVHRSRNFFVPRQLSVVRNGVDLAHFRMAPLSTVGQPCIVGVGSLSPIKRWDRLLRAALALKKRGLDFLVRIAGDGPLHGSLKQQAQCLGISDHVKFIGYNKDIPALLADAAFLVHPSDTEGCPNAVMEAMACGRAVVATDVGDVASLVENGKTGFIVLPGDDGMLAERMAILLTDRDLCRQMGEAGRVKAERDFGLERLVKETLAAYRTAGWKHI
jgi:glycosyltransferase involved in cell wall biosynthesis